MSLFTFLYKTIPSGGLGTGQRETFLGGGGGVWVNNYGRAVTIPRVATTNLGRRVSMPRRQLGEAAWFTDVADLMVRKGVKLLFAAHELDIPLEPLEAEAIATSKPFQRVLWLARDAYYREIMADPAAAKDSTMGRLMLCAQNLMEEGLWDKAAEVLLKLAKVAQWMAPETTVNVIGDLSHKDLEQIRKDLLEQRQNRDPKEATQQTPVN